MIFHSFESQKTLISDFVGRKFGPPKNWQGPEPPTTAELFIKDIPRQNFEHEIIPHFERFGMIYEFRLMMEYNYVNRGYAYLKYVNEEDAICAMDVMKYYLIENGQTLDVQRSYNKCRLFVGNIPRDKGYDEVYNTFQQIFPKMVKFIFHCYGNINRGFAFADFPDHTSALEAKIKCSPGYLYCWGHEIKVVWANPEKGNEGGKEYEVSLVIL